MEETATISLKRLLELYEYEKAVKSKEAVYVVTRNGSYCYHGVKTEKVDDLIKELTNSIRELNNALHEKSNEIDELKKKR